MSDNDLKARLLKSRVPEDTFDIEGVGTVRLRGLSRGEVFVLQKVAKGTDDWERKLLARCLLDPEMTEDEVALWQQSAPAGEMDPVIRKVNELSGLVKSADKEAYKSLRDESGSGVRVLPGGEAEDDSGPASAGDE